ncbi:MAG: patatin-like phospholipase family protein [Gammaproteobacteria bacterium]|nr:patatin-like phospholipase family protein [Gammaproteobacteria bacterium]
MNKAIFLSGGGARGAYQAGVLKCICDILGGGQFPASILSTVSAGAINGAHLAAYADDFRVGTNHMIKLWGSLTSEQIFRAGNLSLAKSVMRNFASMAFHLNLSGGQHLLDTDPLRVLLNEHIDFDRIKKNIDQGILAAFEVATTCYDSSQTISFVHSQDPALGWRKIRHYSQQAVITAEHIMASSAFPMFFPAEKIDNMHYGDGGLRHSSPLRASIKLGAEAILIIGTRKTPEIDALNSLQSITDVNFSKILGMMFNAFLDNLDRDLEHMNTINYNYQLMDSETRGKSAWRELKILYLTPSIDLARIATQKEVVMPFLLRYLMNSFGEKEQSGDFLSFLLFEAAYTEDLIEIGYNDTMQKKDEVEKFFSL